MLFLHNRVLFFVQLQLHAEYKLNTMLRSEFHKLFNSKGPVVLPVVHVLDIKTTTTNIKVILDSGAKGCFLINHDFSMEKFLPIIEAVRVHYLEFWIGINFLGVTGLRAFPILAKLKSRGFNIDAYWADDARIDERANNQYEAEKINYIRQTCDWDGLYFGGTAFKKQRIVKPQQITQAAKIAGRYMDVITTSGNATGLSADMQKIIKFRNALSNKPIALASGVTPENAKLYDRVDCFMVSTGINQKNDFYNVDPARLALLIKECDGMGRNDDRRESSPLVS